VAYGPGGRGGWDGAADDPEEEPEEVVWIPEARYLDAWRVARDAADELEKALSLAGVHHSVLTEPSTDARGLPVLRFRGRADVTAALRMASLLRRGAGALPEQSAGGGEGAGAV
jgi:hypothetical protein